ncbi:hypothetical protein G6F55_013558 [Rhizopus delemar]|nr:hypothetical protein G6F55_013558 [Rhizopus delemar]
MDGAIEPPGVRALCLRSTASQAPERTAASGWAGPRSGVYGVTYGVLALCAATALLGLRKLPERRAENPAPLRLSRLLAPLSYRDVPVLLLACLAFSSAFYGVYAFLADHVRTLLALSAGQVGFIAFAYGAGFLLAGIAGAPLIERLGPRRALPLALA